MMNLRGKIDLSIVVNLSDLCKKYFAKKKKKKNIACFLDQKKS